MKKKREISKGDKNKLFSTTTLMLLVLTAVLATGCGDKAATEPIPAETASQGYEDTEPTQPPIEATATPNESIGDEDGIDVDITETPQSEEEISVAAEEAPQSDDEMYGCPVVETPEEEPSDSTTGEVSPSNFEDGEFSKAEKAEIAGKWLAAIKEEYERRDIQFVSLKYIGDNPEDSNSCKILTVITDEVKGERVGGGPFALGTA